MSKTLTERVQIARDRAEIARLRIDTAIDTAKYKRLKKVNQIRAGFDALDSSHRTQRKQVSREKSNEDDQLSALKKSKGVALGRNLHRNVGWFKTLMQQFKVCVVGTGPKAQFNTGVTNFDKEASDWLNSDWAKWCDGVDDTPLAEQVSLALTSIKREGDVLCVFDDFDRDDGTLRWFEADQLVTISATSWRKQIDNDDCIWREEKEGSESKTLMAQKDGIIRDYRGRVLAYVVSAERGLSEVNYEDVTIIPRWNIRHNPTGSAVLIKTPWRFGQRRGQSEAITISNQLADIYEMISAELQSAKNSSQRAGWIELDKDTEGSLERALINAGKTPAEIDAMIYGDADSNGSYGNNYEELEATFGGRVDYLSPGETFKAHDQDRPASSVSDFGGFIQEASGASMGLGRSNSTLKAEASYTAYRGEQLMTWQTFYADQKMLERRLMDFLAYKAITWAKSKNEIKTALPEKWYKNVLWSWPKMQEVDEGRTASAEEKRLKNGTTTYADIFGPNWEKKFNQLGKELTKAQNLDLPLAIFEMKSGGLITTTTKNGE